MDFDGLYVAGIFKNDSEIERERESEKKYHICVEYTQNGLV